MSIPRWLLTGFLIVTLLVPGASASRAQPAAPRAAEPSSAPTGSTIFIENAGQWPDGARFQVWGSPLGAGTAWLAEDGIWLVVSRQVDWEPSRSDKEEVDKEERARCDDPLAYLSTYLPPSTSHALKLTFPGSNPDVRIEPFNPLTTTVSYFIGSDPEQWRPAVPVWGGVRYVGLYPGVDLVLDGRDRFWQLEAAPGAATEEVQIQVAGADAIAFDGVALQLDVAGEPQDVALPSASFMYPISELSRQGASLPIDTHPGQRPSHGVRPADNPADLLYGTYLGGSGDEDGWDIAVDETGNAYMTGRTKSGDFPSTPGAFDPSRNGSNDAFVVKLNPAGSALVYATFLGGSQSDEGYAIAVDGIGSVYLTGKTSSLNFPITPDASDPSYNGGDRDAFVVKLNPAGSGLVYSTFLGGSGDDYGYGIAIDEPRSAYVTGATESADFPTTPGAFDTSYRGGDAFVVKLSPSGGRLVYATFLGDSGGDSGTAIAADGTGSAYVTGNTYGTDTSDFPTTPGAFDPSFNGYGDAFVAKLNPTGSELDYATFLGGWGDDGSTAIAVDGTGSAYVAGSTASGNFPTTPGAFDPSFNDFYDGFVAKLDPAGSRLAYATFLGGHSYEHVYDMTVDGAGAAYVTGPTRSGSFPVTPGAFDTSYSCCFADAFVARLNAAGSHLDYATFLGGMNDDWGNAIAVDGAGSAYIMGGTKSDSFSFPISPGAFDQGYNGGYSDAFVVKLNTVYAPNVLAPIEQPGAGAFVSGTVALSGFAIDRASTTGTGIDRVQIYLDGPYGTGTIIGTATYALDRPEIGLYGDRFRYSGWELVWNASGLAPGVHRLYLYAHRTTDNAWSVMDPHLVIVRAAHGFWLPLGIKS